MSVGAQYPDDCDQWRQRVYERDGYRCQRCGVGGGPHGNVELHAHHMVPVSEGGSHEWANLVTVYADCHEEIHAYEIGDDDAGITSAAKNRPGRTRESVIQRVVWDILYALEWAVILGFVIVVIIGVVLLAGVFLL